ncbi:MAG: carbamoyltransferase HypF [bacterium]|nr:MAG: carbamoyltransferase HypF [bacterium]
MKEKLKVNIKGAVQGVGFRPFIYGLARSLNLTGYVLNSTTGVTIEVEGNKQILDQFIMRIENEKPTHAVIHSMEFSFLDFEGFENFSIRQSQTENEISAVILPDIAVCGQCLEELYNPSDRRYLYPFINCTHCGPRYSLIESLPYDRPNTSMKKFEMCPDCREEYEDPANRRFHAQPIACPVCGPQIRLWNETGSTLSVGTEALDQTLEYLSSGHIIAVKGLGGFHLMVDAVNQEAVERLRFKKHREEKPFAVMFPDLSAVRSVCAVSEFDARLLQSSESPIVLLKKLLDSGETAVAPCTSVAPGNPYLGVMLPYTPLHHLLLSRFDKPLVATSGNLSEEPMCIDEADVLKRLAGIADLFLIHDRPIVRPIDDSIVRVMEGRELILRRARGYAPLPILIDNPEYELNPQSMSLAVGAHLKNTIAVQKGKNVFLSQHIGDLSTQESVNSFENIISDIQRMYQISPQKVMSDLHPDYISTTLAREWYGNPIPVQHHEAHIASCRAENQVTGKALGVAWDGTGYGHDGTIWGGEFFISEEGFSTHYAQMRQFLLVGGDQAIKDPRKSALGVLFEMYGEAVFENNKLEPLHFSSGEIKIFRKMLKNRLNCFVTSSAGRLFDAIAALIGVCQKINYEGQAAMMLEFVADHAEMDAYSFEILEAKPLRIDWSAVIHTIIEDLGSQVSASRIAMKFHRGLSRLILLLAQKSSIEKVILSGGCFQNAILLEYTIQLLRDNGFRPYWHQRVPPNDGGIALGQISLGLHAGRKGSSQQLLSNVEKINL